MLVHRITQIRTEEYHTLLCDRLQRSAEWRLCLDEHFRQGHRSDLFSDTGLVYYSYTRDRDWSQIAATDPARGWFNAQAEQILSDVINQIQARNCVIHRVMWNYYNRASEGILHQDYDQPGLWSMVYNLSDTDGGTEIAGEFYPGSQGSAVIFPSETWHRGQGPRSQPRRFVLNCIFAADFADK